MQGRPPHLPSSTVIRLSNPVFTLIFSQEMPHYSCVTARLILPRASAKLMISSGGVLGPFEQTEFQKSNL
jgi:hypothetical protein